MKNFYEIVRIQDSDDLNVVKQVFRKVFPDKNGSSDSADCVGVESVIWTTLKDSLKRAENVRWLTEQKLREVDGSESNRNSSMNIPIIRTCDQLCLNQRTPFVNGPEDIAEYSIGHIFAPNRMIVTIPGENSGLMVRDIIRYQEVLHVVILDHCTECTAIGREFAIVCMHEERINGQALPVNHPWRWFRFRHRWIRFIGLEDCFCFPVQIVKKILAPVCFTMIRRTLEVNNDHLPDKHEYVVFCRPSTVQRRVFTAISEHILGKPLVLIDYMRKLSNNPAILYKKLAENETKGNSQFSHIMAAFPPNYGNRSAVLSHSGKLIVLLEMLACFRSAEECCVIVSNYTKTLDMISGLCSSIGLNIFRLDGSVPVSDRQKLVNAFNEQWDPANVFLLSTKAGGVGLNLIGASRLILFDSDWNPASDLQAMARIWRDGQIKTCHIYRMATTGTVVKPAKVFTKM